MKDAIRLFEELKPDGLIELEKRQTALNEVLELYKDYSDELYQIITENAHKGSCGHTLDRYGRPLKALRMDGVLDRSFWHDIDILLRETNPEENHKDDDE